MSDTWSAAQLKEKLDSASDKQLRQVVRESGLLPRRVVRLLTVFEDQYDPDYSNKPDDPYYAWETQRYRQIVKLHASQRLATAVRDGNAQVINHFLGLVDQSNSISDAQFYERFRNWVTRTASVTYIAANMGYGKTDFALLMAESWLAAQEGGVQDGKPVRLEVASNVKSCPESRNITSQPELAEWMKDRGDDDEEVLKLFIFDEASSHASGYGKDRSKVQQQLSSMVKLMRKNGGNIIIIGHTGKDVHPDIRRLADYAQKISKKKAIIYEDVSEGKGRGKKLELSEIPATTWQFDTNEESKWEWATGKGQDGPDMTEIACRTYMALKDGKRKTQKEVAEMFGMTQANISQNYKKYK